VLASLVQSLASSTTAVLEVTTIIAMVVYAVAARLISRLTWLALSRPRYVRAEAEHRASRPSGKPIEPYVMAGNDGGANAHVKSKMQAAGPQRDPTT
jgi:hypothetical protein